jgi:short-subunit dehydrogenase
MLEPSPDRPLALVTGASSGIGSAFCRRLALGGFALAMVARDAEAMAALAATLDRDYGTPSLILPIDLARPGAAAEVMRQLADKGLTVEILINNAGFGKGGLFHEQSREEVTGMVMVNDVAATELALAVLPGMVERRHGRILNVASVAAFVPGPMMAVYFASKAYLLSLSEALSEELRGTGVTVTALCPGPTVSNFQRRAGMQMPRGLPVASAAEVVRVGYDSMMRGERLVVPGAANRLGAFLTRVAPKGIVLRQLRRLQEKR